MYIQSGTSIVYCVTTLVFHLCSLYVIAIVLTLATLRNMNLNIIT